MNDGNLHKNQSPDIPAIHIISDSLGISAQPLVRAASSQFGIMQPKFEILSRVKSFKQITDFLQEHLSNQEDHCKEIGMVNGAASPNDKILVFYTLVDENLREQLVQYVNSDKRIIAVDLLTEAIAGISKVCEMPPSQHPGALHVANTAYFKRIEAIEFTINHDDGRNPNNLIHADIVLIGVSRTSKTPLSIYLAQEGYKVANIPLDNLTTPPSELFEVESSRIFGLTTTPEVLGAIRQRRLGNALGVASDYANKENIYAELESARALMKRLGCIVVRTDNRAVEETAQEILGYYKLVH